MNGTSTGLDNAVTHTIKNPIALFNYQCVYNRHYNVIRVIDNAVFD